MSIRIAVVALALLAPSVALSQVLSVESIRGSAELQFADEATQPLSSGQYLYTGNRIKSPSNGHVRLAFARYGFIDIGPDSELVVERIPHASFATDLRSVFRLRRGYMRVVWKHPQISTFWPIFVYVGNQRASLTSGEFFVENRNGRHLACVAAGQLALTDSTTEAPQTLHPQACYRLYQGMPSQRVLRDQDDWVAIRERFDIGDLPGAELAAAEPPPARPAPRRAEAAAPSAAAAVTSTAADEFITDQARTSSPAVAPAASGSKPSEAPAAAAAPGGPWAVAIASFRSVRPATDLAAKLQAAGFPARVVPVTVKGNPWSRVILAGFDSAGAAKAAGGEVEAEMGLKGAWVLRFEP